MKVLQINTTLNTTSTGRIAEEIGRSLMQNGHESYIASARIGPEGSLSNYISIGNVGDLYLHIAKSRLVDGHGFGSKNATKQLVEKIKEIDPDVIGLHNLHGYYLNIEILFSYLKQVQKPVLWTLHDCWPFTGHCSFFDFVSCEKWKSECNTCPLSNKYPASWWLDNSRENFHRKSELFNGIENLVLVTPSYWLKGLVAESFLSSYPATVINNGVDLEQFRPVATYDAKDKYGAAGKYIILGVASVWDRRKGLPYFYELNKKLDDRFKILLVGLDDDSLKRLPDGMTGITRTENLQELVALYNIADVFVNPTLVDNFPTTNLEALACGTPVITFDTGGSPEAISSETGFVVEKGNSHALHEAIIKVISKGKEFYQASCRERAVQNYNKKDRFAEYLDLYQQIVGQAEENNVEGVMP